MKTQLFLLVVLCSVLFFTSTDACDFNCNRCLLLLVCTSCNPGYTPGLLGLYCVKSAPQHTCDVTLESWGWYDDTPSGGISINGEKVYDDSKQQDSKGTSLGIQIAELDFNSCKIGEVKVFNVRVQDGTQQFIDYINQLSSGKVILAISADTLVYGVNHFKPAYGTIESLGGPTESELNADPNVSQWWAKILFIAQKGYPSKTIFETAPKGGSTLKQSFVVEGTLPSSLTITKA